MLATASEVTYRGPPVGASLAPMTPERLERWGKAFMLAWNLLLLGAIAQIWTGAAPYPAADIGTTAAVLGLLVLWTWYWARLRRRDWWQGGLLAGGGMAVIALTIELALPPGTSILIFSACVLGASLPPRLSVPAVFTATLLSFLVDLPKGHAGVATSIAFNNLLVGLLAVGGRLFVTSFFDLHDAREEIARLAVAEERLRFSRDLHDLLGHSLAVIVLKSEVASRQLPESSPARAEVAEIAAVARRSLDQVREAVSGYRVPALDQELASAREVLAAAGVQVAFDNRAGRLPPPAESVLGWAVREAATNVIKHSTAHRCEVRIWREDASVRLEVENDGAPEVPSLAPGNGLHGLQERAALLAGSVDVSSSAGRFTLRVSIPVEERPALQPA